MRYGRPGPSLRAALAVALALALGAGLASGSGTAAAESPDEATADESTADEPATITTELHPGWNLIGWIGPETPVADLFEEIAALEQVSALDAQAGSYVAANRGAGSATGSLSRLTPGMGLWLKVGGDEIVAWTRPAPAESVLLQLYEDANDAAWFGGPGTLADTLAGLGDALDSVQRWDAETQAFETYDPDDATTATVLDSIAVGDGLRIDLTEPARWWPQGTAPPPVVFVGDVDADTAIALATAYERGRRLFIERFDAPEAAEITGYIYADAESLGSVYRERYGRDLPEGWCVFRVGAELHQSASCHSSPDSRMGERYFNAVVVEVAPSSELPTAEVGYHPWGPQWLVLGMQKYSSAAYISAFGSSTYESLRAQHVARARAVTLPLSSMETDDGRDAAGWWETASLGFLASESLARRAGEEALVEYLRLLSSSTSWQEAFEGAFEISVADFHEAFEAQRTASIPFLPHLADDVDEPILVFIGDIAPEVQEELRTSLEASQYLFEAQFGSRALDFTAYFGSDLETVTPEYISVRGHAKTELCGDHDGKVIFQVITCKNRRLVLAHEYFHVLQDDLAVDASWGPVWLTEGAAVYGEALHRAIVEQGLTASEGLDYRRRWEAARVLISGDDSPLASFETVDSAERLHYRLGFLAADWLAEDAGVAALAEYYKQLPESDSWQEAFEEAFGTSVADFYETFETYRTGISPLLTHFSDDREGPAVVFLGEIPSTDQAALESDIETAGAFFAERFEAGHVGSTIFIGDDAESVDPIHWVLFEEGPPADLCHRRQGPAIVYLTSCEEPLESILGDAFYYALRDQLGPWSDLPPAEDGYERYGPQWLILGARQYVEALYRASNGDETYDELRTAQVAETQQTVLPLSQVETAEGRDTAGWWGTVALGFLATESLAEDAGDEAIFEYYRLLPSSTSWQEAFEEAFDTSVADFYVAFETLRADVAPPLPHLTAEGDGTTVLFLGDVDPDAQTAAAAEVEQVQTFFAERFGVEATELFVYVGEDLEAIKEVYRSVFGREPDPWFCYRNSASVIVYATSCSNSFESIIGIAYSALLGGQIAPWSELPAEEADYDRYGPQWWVLGAREYANVAYRASSGDEPYDDLRAAQITTARKTALTLSGTETRAGRDAAGWSETVALGFLATESLAEDAGDEAIFEYYRLLPSSTSWQEAFEEAFDTSVADFYTAFETHRADVAPPLPQIRGVVLDPDGEPLEGVGLWILQHVSGAYRQFASTAADGTFKFAVADDTYRILIMEHREGDWIIYGHYGGPDGFSTSNIRVIVVDGADVTDIVIQLPAPLSELPVIR